MTAAARILDHTARSGVPSRGADQPLPSTRELLTQGGDARIEIDPASGLNRYLCPAGPADIAGFGSSTASVISAHAFAAADDLRRRLDEACRREPPAAVYRRETARLRRELTALCGLELTPGLAVLLAPSGTDIHRLVGELTAAGRQAPTFGVAIETCETGSGVPAALAGEGGGLQEQVCVAARGPDGRPRAASAIAADLDQAVEALAPRGRVLISVADLSKTGLLSFDLAQVFALRRRFAGRIDVLVDACQWRLSNHSLRAYLEHDCLVAVTGSKFLGGPTFSGALFAPGRLADRLSRVALAPGMAGHAARADLPPGWAGADGLADAANFGLLVRWEAALAELRALRALPDWKIARALQALGRLVRERLDADPAFEPLATPLPDRRALGEASWDAAASIFPFLLRRADGADYLTPAETAAVYRALAGQGLLLGQPVACGERSGAPIAALRLCLSAPLLVEAVGGDVDDVARRITAAFDQAAQAARATTSAG